MAQDSVEKLFGRLLTDAVFREYARKNFHRACLEIGLSLTQEEGRLISRIAFEKFEAMAEEIDDGLKRCGLSTRPGEGICSLLI